jgi:hypothetical protein
MNHRRRSFGPIPPEIVIFNWVIIPGDTKDRNPWNAMNLIRLVHQSIEGHHEADQQAMFSYCPTGIVGASRETRTAISIHLADGADEEVHHRDPESLSHGQRFKWILRRNGPRFSLRGFPKFFGGLGTDLPGAGCRNHDQRRHYQQWPKSATQKAPPCRIPIG